ncbi:4-diphosphocytidyl-2-C-methyl-D-erythritol kinase [Sporotomaculum syntrophicum]|uniref:4-diphosphocytidyl-2-C-methyl-D-erythritol kinase n=1 Tax=Sporotomaculum syntrophicum TaxID=182264 RepID=A0A9D3AY98_9FIRM|nr:4-(cytidine 5'-diphospho)-2-C-methyl-D-erythritol kinase [Sporotomaculum syntrophicum]KAF1085842.1 4-diphosphocytidyl-2-C-methyl-D-erythritol kinase [Sporotomaculum syntrophicum]
MLVRAYAKINLVLDVLGTRADGYHELFTIMQTLDLHDVVELTEARDIELVVEGANLTAGPENLAYRAADLLRRQSGYSKGAKIKLVKHIPIEAGLAGGSADAAAVLRGLNELWKLGMGVNELESLGAVIGSDVPFCLKGGTALVQGRGEKVDSLPSLPPLAVLLVKPSFGLSTGQVYRMYDDIKKPFHPDGQGMLQAVCCGDVSGVVARLGNALEQVVLARHSEIREIKEILAAFGANGVLMSGSGPTVFGLFDNESLAVKTAGRLQKRNFGVWATKFCTSKAGWQTLRG